MLDFVRSGCYDCVCIEFGWATDPTRASWTLALQHEAARNGHGSTATDEISRVNDESVMEHSRVQSRVSQWEQTWRRKCRQE